MAERVGFEPTDRSTRSPDFESGALGRSAISPQNENVLSHWNGKGNPFLRGFPCVLVPDEVRACRENLWPYNEVP